MPPKPAKKRTLPARGRTLRRRFGPRLRSELDDRGVTQLSLVRETGVGQANLSKFLTGARGLETEKLLTILEICVIRHGISLDRIVREISTGVTIKTDKRELARRLEDLARQLGQVVDDEAPASRDQSGKA